MKKLISLCMALLLLAGMLTVSASDYVDPAVVTPPAVNETALHQAQALKSLGLFRGSDKGLELDRAPTRMEAIIMLIRLMGMENEALGGMYESPFTDAPTWMNAASYLGYAYEMGLTKGVSETSFDPNSPASLQMIATFTLRALGHTENTWENWETLSADVKLIPDAVNHVTFTRGDAVLVYYNALECKMAGSRDTLAENLMANWVFTEEQYDTAQKIAEDKIDHTSSLEEIMAATYATMEGTFEIRTMNMEINKDNMVQFLGVDDLKIAEGLASEPMMNAQAHSLCLIRLKKGEDVEAAMQAIRENVDPRKWLCVGVEPENVIVECTSNNLIILVMNDVYAADLVTAFQALGQ